MDNENKSNIENEKLNEEPKDSFVVTHHSILCGGKKISYTATAGRMILKEEIVQKEGDQKNQYEGEKPRAEIFFVAYTLDGVDDPTKRPITFAFNGGPGSASIWIHMGLLGPKRVLLNDDGTPLPPPARLIENEYSVLDMTDLVFIDPIGTGFSRAVKGDKPNDYWGWTKDVESVGDFIRLYISRNQRWGSPKFIAGESYGTTRTTGLSDYLSDKYGMYLNGIVLVSTALDFATLDFNDGNDLPYILYLPSYAATAWYHKKLKAKYQEMPLEKYLEEVRHFAGGEYLQALFNGSRMAEKQIEQVADKTANYIGLTRDYVLRANLRVTLPRFSKELLRSERRTVGRYDGRFIGIDRDAAGEEPEDDPAGYEINGTFAGAFNDYICRELGYKTDLPYAFSTDLWKTWSYKEYENKYVQLEEVLRKTMVRNKFMKVWVLNGYYDMATPFYASEYVFSHLQLDPVLQPNLSLTYYEAGHMMYIHKPSLEKFRKDAEFFFENALKA
ncbi:MAG TPA: hypothetical protein P5198_01185 [Flexilinea sp.]|nr:hypothetical protein [Flexilinea sp.]